MRSMLESGKQCMKTTLYARALAFSTSYKVIHMFSEALGYGYAFCCVQ